MRKSSPYILPLDKPTNQVPDGEGEMQLQLDAPESSLRWRYKRDESAKGSIRYLSIVSLVSVAFQVSLGRVLADHRNFSRPSRTPMAVGRSSVQVGSDTLETPTGTCPKASAQGWERRGG